jgi:hypothetical protein
MTKEVLLEKIAKRLLNSLDCLNGDNNWYRCEDELVDEIQDMRDILYNFQDKELACENCMFSEERSTHYIGEYPYCRFWNKSTAWLYYCPSWRIKE